MQVFIILIAIVAFIIKEYWPIILTMSIITFIIFFIYETNKKKNNDRLDRSLNISEVDFMDGIEFEHYVCKLLINEGLKATVTRASNDYGVDIVAQDLNNKYAVQVKRYSSNVSRRAVSDAVAGKEIYECNKAMVITNSYYSKGALELAKSTSCELVDRDQLSEWIYRYQNLNRKEETISSKELSNSKIEKKDIKKQLEKNQLKSGLNDEIIKHVRKEFSNDTEMQKYEFEEQLLSKKIMNTVSDLELKKISTNEYPEDYEMQEYTYKEQLSSKKFMNKVSDLELKGIAANEYSEDYTMQEYTYKEQLASKKFMNKVMDLELKKIATNEYSEDYTMQEYTYKEQLSSKKFMNKVSNSTLKKRVQNEYPEDYSMQEYEYKDYQSL